MKRNHKAAAKGNQAFAEQFKATFGDIRLPQAGRKSLVAMGVACLLATGAASADWRVKDEDAIKVLEDIRDKRIGETNAGGDSGNGSITGNQKLSYDQYTLNEEYQNSGEPVEHPQWPAASGGGEGGEGGEGSESGFKLEAFKDMMVASGGTGGTSGGGAMALETNIDSCAKWRDEQKAICEEIIKTQNAQFIYSVRFHEMTANRLTRLQEIEEERGGLDDSPANYGKLQDNTNKLLALNTRMALDEAQMESAMKAYDTRLAYLQRYQTQLTSKKLTGDQSEGGGGLFDFDPGALGSALVSGAALKLALESQESDPPQGYRRMDWLD